MTRKNTQEIFRYEGKKRVKDFIAIVNSGMIVRIKKFEDKGNESGYILPRQIDENNLEDYFGQCSNCQAYFPDMLNNCDHCDEPFCCECADQHRDEIAEEYSTGGCNF